MENVIYEKEVESVILKSVGSRVMYDVLEEGNTLTIRRLHTSGPNNGDQTFDSVNISKEMLLEIVSKL